MDEPEGKQESHEAAFHTVVQESEREEGKEEMGEDERKKRAEDRGKEGERERRGELGTHEDLLGSPVPSLQAETSKHLNLHGLHERLSPGRLVKTGAAVGQLERRLRRFALVCEKFFLLR